MEDQIRIAAFRWLEEQVQIRGDVLPRTLLQKGFIFNDERITLMGRPGIWKPKAFKRVPLSITTVAGGPYDDKPMEEFLAYRYRGTDPNSWDNAGLREAWEKQIPLIYFLGVTKGRYLAVWPVFIIDDDPRKLTFTIAADEPLSVEQFLNSSSVAGPTTAKGIEYRRSYITATVKQRLHQKSFRERVLEAYGIQCTFCRLKHLELLDAAHIIPDSEEYGEPVINNGLSLCKIHHAAFDSNILGVTPDYQIAVREDVLEEKDGPMLLHGLQQLHNKKIILPRHEEFWPDRERLEVRFEKFRAG